MKHTLSLSVDDEIIEKVKKIAEENRMKISEVASKVFEAGFKMGEPVMVRCPLCSTEYLNKLGFCPKCKLELEAREQLIQNESGLAVLKERYINLMDWKEKGFFVTENEITKVKGKIEELEGRLNG